MATEQSLARLDDQMKGAVVKPLENGQFAVFVPGAVREYNQVEAADEVEALAKTKRCLAAKSEARSDEEKAAYEPQEGDEQ